MNAPLAAVHPGLRLLLALPAVAALLCGVLSGLARLGLPVPPVFSTLITAHGALMVGGFFGTLIGLERAVALGKTWPYLGPLLSGIGALLLIAGAPAQAAAILMCLAAAVMVAACVHVWRRQPVAHHTTLAIAALAWLAGNAVWLWQGHALGAVPLWAAFLILTIAAERLELSRFVPTPPLARTLFAVIVAVLLAGALLGTAQSGIGLRIYAFALLALALWLLRYDVARRTLRTAGLTRYMAICLLSGYLWLGVAGMLGMAGAFQNGLRDAALHALLLGFVFSMVFGHAPIILPALTRLKVHWHAGFHLPLMALHYTLTLRVAAGISNDFVLRQQAALGNAVVLGLFLAMTAISLLRTGRKQPAKHRAYPQGGLHGRTT